jgi:pantoate--beta-alanine ligase
MKTVFDLQSLRQVIAEWKREGSKIAFVPTMGNLHAGHISLLEKAREAADRTVVSIFVNPIQFGKGEDYENYPSTLDADSKKLETSNLDLLFVPNLKELYPGGVNVDTRVNIPKLSSILCGKFRPGHFSGVATVVTKLLINVTPDYAFFGEKDYQQLLIIRRLVSELCMPTEIIGMPIVRESDGLAMSSRNAYLNEAERKVAPVIYKILQAAAERLLQQTVSFKTIEVEGVAALEAAGLRPEYVSIRRTSDLGEPESDDHELSILVAAWLGSARLIDNLKVNLNE